MKHFSSNIKEIKKTETPEKIPYISPNGNPKIASYVSRIGIFPSARENFLYFRK